MALEFECSYCKATIRVPDNSAGKRGRCPKCASKISIPKLGQARRAGDEPVFFPGPPEPGSVSVAEPPSDEDVIFQEYDPQRDSVSDPAAAADLLPGDILIPDLSPGIPRSLPQGPRQLPDSLLSRSKRKCRSGGMWMLLIVVLLLAGAAGGGLYWYQASAVLEGELTAAMVENPQLPLKIVPRSLIEMPPGEAEKILDDLERNPSNLVSSLGLATVQFRGGPKGLMVAVSPGTATSLYRVDLSSDAKLRKYRQQHAAEFEQTRQEHLAIAVNRYFRTIKQVSSKRSVASDLGTFRDSVGLAASVEGFGSVVQAVHNRQIYPCVYEDDDAIYFLLPAGVKQFQLRGKARRGSEPFFDGQFEVKVAGKTRLKGAEPEEPAPNEKPADENSEESEMMSEEPKSEE